MSVYNTYQELKQAVARWLTREDDPDIGARAAEFIGLCEAQIRRNQEWFTELWSDQNSGDPYAVTDIPVELPVYVNAVTSLWTESGISKDEIPVVTMEEWRRKVNINNDATGIPRVATFVDRKSRGLGPLLYLWPRPDTSSEPYEIDFEYLRDVPTLEDDPSFLQNNLVKRHPDLYLYGSLIESMAFYEHDARLPLWEKRFDRAVEEINRESERIRSLSHSKRIRLARSF